MDLIGKRMMVSQNRWVRALWWLPQAAGSGFSIGAGVHNMAWRGKVSAELNSTS